MYDYISSYEMPQENAEWLRGVILNDDWRTTAVQISDEMVEKAVVGFQKVCTDFLQREQALTKRLRVLESSGQEAKQQVEEAAARQAAGLQGTPIALSSADGVFPQSFPSRC